MHSCNGIAFILQNSDEDAIKAMEKVVKWSTQNILPLLKQRRQHKRRLLTQSEATMASQGKLVENRRKIVGRARLLQITSLMTQNTLIVY